MNSRRLAALFLGTVAALSFGSASFALDVHTYGVTLTGAQEVPPVATAGIGVATVTLNDVTGAVSVSGNFSGLTSTAILAHIHGLAPPGMNAGILVTLTETGGTSGAVTGSGTLSPANITGMLNGLCYLNIHSNNFPGGEIRGQITTEVPAMPWKWVALLAVLAIGGGTFALSRRAPTPV